MPDNTKYYVYKITYNKAETLPVIFKPKEDWKRYKKMAEEQGGYATVQRRLVTPGEWEVIQEAGIKPN